jgi:16S rRNA processing protein RimM
VHGQSPGLAVRGTESVLPFGVLRRPHGTAGDIALSPFNPKGARIDQLPLPVVVVLVQHDRKVEKEIVACRPVHGGFLLRFAGASSREEVASLVGHVLHLPRSAFGTLGRAEFYVEDVVGCEVVDTGGKELGRVAGTFWNGAHDVMTIVDGNGNEMLVAVVPQHVVGYDRDMGRLTVDLHE